MADLKNQGVEYPEKTTEKVSSTIGTSSFLDRTVTFNTASSAVADANSKPLYDLCTTPAFQRGRSFRSLYSSPFGSMVSAGNTLRGKVWKLCSIFETARNPTKHPDSQSLLLTSPPSTSSKPNKFLLPAPDSSNLSPRTVPPSLPDSPFRLPGTENRVVVYLTSLRGIRRTFQDCHSIRMIFRGFRVNLDERDISMDAEYRKELQRVLGENNVSLPQVFIKGKYIGGADVIRQLVEAGELVRLIKGLPLRALKPCEACDDAKFFLCTVCNGSRKVYDEDEELPKRCTECNENGLVRCPLCCL